MKKNKAPEIRFAGFSEDWDNNPLSIYLEVSNKRNRNLQFTKNDVLSVSGEYGIVNQIEFQGRSFAGETVKDYHVVDIGDVVYTKSPLKANPYGIIKANKIWYCINFICCLSLQTKYQWLLVGLLFFFK